MIDATLRQIGSFGLYGNLPAIDDINNPVVVAPGSNNIAEGTAVNKQISGTTDQRTSQVYVTPESLVWVALIGLALYVGALK